MSIPVLDLPLPPPEAILGWCTECASAYTGAAQEQVKDKLADAHRDGKHGYKRITVTWGNLPMLEPAVAWGVSATKYLQMFGTVPLCWSHLPCVKLGGILPASQLGGSARGLG